MIDDAELKHEIKDILYGGHTTRAQDIAVNRVLNALVELVRQVVREEAGGGGATET